jgi:hypothetical protein
VIRRAARGRVLTFDRVEAVHVVVDRIDAAPGEERAVVAEEVRRDAIEKIGIQAQDDVGFLKVLLGA